MTVDLKAAALGYTGFGWRVVPCCPVRDGAGGCGWSGCKAPGKHPLVKNWCEAASSDPARVADWWTRHPDANVGVATGPGSNLFALDLDSPEAMAALQQLEVRFGMLPATVTARTGKGTHLYFRWDAARPLRNRVRIGGVPIDVRGEGGNLIAPPSTHLSGARYEWLNPPDRVEVAPAPGWLLDHLGTDQAAPLVTTTPGFGPEGEGLDLRTARGVLAGGRHDAATRLVGAHLGRGEDPFQVLHLAYQWADRCDPPMDRDELFGVVKHFADKDAARLDEAVVTTAREPEWPRLEDEALYGLAGEVVRAIEPNTEADPAAVLVQLLALFGNEVGRGPHALVGPTKHHANLFVMVVGESSKGKKGTALRDAMDPFGDALKPRIGSGLSSGEGLIARVTDAVYRKEPVRDKDKKVTGYQDVLDTPAAEDKRLVVLETEFGSVLQVMKRDGNTVSSLIRNAWDDGNLATMTKVPRKATGAHIPMIGHITPQELASLLTDTDVFNGFANRFLWAGSEGTRVLPWPKPHDLRDLRPRLAEAARVAQTRTVVGRDAGAERLWGELCHGELSRGHAGRLDTLAGRSRPQVIRLSLIYALLDGSPVIREEHVRAAVAVWRYCLGSARVIFGDATGDEVADRLSAAIRERPRTTTELYRVLGNHATRARVQAALQVLVRGGLVRSEVVKTTGRPGRRWLAA